jgi:glycosyltransferase involved in cell wall biosynthesis
MGVQVRWHAPGYDPSGYAACARDYILALHKLGAEVKFEPVSFWSTITGALSNKKYDLLHSLEFTPVSQNAPRVIHLVPDCYKKDKLFHIRTNIGFTVFETNGVPPAWIPKMQMMDYIWTASKFNKQTFTKAVSAEKIKVFPHIIDTDKFTPDVEPFKIKPEKDFYFLTIMDVTERKNWKGLIRAYCREFHKNRDVGLIFKGYFNGTSIAHQKALIAKIQTYRDSLRINNCPDIIFYGDIIKDDLLPRLYKSADCCVLPVHGGGFELFLAESMSMEKPTIATNWSAHLDFMNNDNSYLIDILRMIPTDDDMIRITPNYQGQDWADPSEAHLRQLMRWTYEHRDEAKAKGINARQSIINHCHWKKVGTDIINELKKFQ